MALMFVSYVERRRVLFMTTPGVLKNDVETVKRL